jgi:cyanophycinase
MTGIIALQGGGPFADNDDLDRALLSEIGVTDRTTGRVVVLPTAEAFEQPDRMAAAAAAWGDRLGVEVETVMVLNRGGASDPTAVAAVRAARAVYLVGDQPLHLRSVVKDTPVWDALCEVIENGGLVVGVGPSASALCDPMVDPRGGAFMLGLGLVGGLAFVGGSDQLSAERLHRTLELADTTVACAPVGSALVHRAAGWTVVGDVDVHGELPG